MEDLYIFAGIYIVIMIMALPLIFNKVKRNGLYGLRTPWSMYSDETWYKSNKVGGYLLFIPSLISLIVIIVYPYEKIMMASIFVLIAFAVYSAYYSYTVYKKEKLKGAEKLGEEEKSHSKKSFRGVCDLRSLMFFVLSIIFAGIAFFYQVREFGDLNRKIATHFNARGVADGFMIAKDFLMTNVYIFLILFPLMSLVVFSIYYAGKIAKAEKKDKTPNGFLIFLKPLKDMKLVDALSLVFIFISLFVYEMNASVLLYDKTKEFSIAGSMLSMIYLTLSILIYSGSVWLRRYELSSEEISTEAK